MQTQVVVITGASGGIGAALASQLASEGRSLVLAARREPELQAVSARCGGRAQALATDVTRRADVERLRDFALSRFGRIDAWINNAGRGISKPVLALTDEDLDDMMAVNVKSALYGMQAVVPHFQERGSGHLVNVASFLGRVPLASHRSAYSAAKAALISLSANLRMDLRESHPGIRVSVVLPGLVDTDFARNALLRGGAHQAFAPKGPMKPQTAEEVAASISALLRHPRAELYTNPVQSLQLAQQYVGDVEAFEERLRTLR